MRSRRNSASVRSAAAPGLTTNVVNGDYKCSNKPPALPFRDRSSWARGGFTTKARRARSFCRGWFWWLVVGGWWLVVGGWWLAVGGWWLVVGGWWLVVGGYQAICFPCFPRDSVATRRAPPPKKSFVSSCLRVKPRAPILCALGVLCGEPDAG
jgi:hypothetical protein